MRIFVDTNVLASALATRGLCADLFEIVINEHELLTCEAVLKELRRVLTAKFKLPSAVAAAFCKLLEGEAELILAPDTPGQKLNDPSDTPIVACAIVARADVFVAGDKMLLDLRTIENLAILSLRQLWQQPRS